MAITPPENPLWWNEPIEKTEVTWISVALVWALILFFMMPYWHIAGKQNLSNEAYEIGPAAFEAKVNAMVDKHKTAKTVGANNVPVVHPPAGSDVYLLARLWEWYPILELEKGQNYRFHLSSLDYLHGFSLLPENINIQIHPDYELVFTLTPTSSGEFGLICNEFCGIGHHTMSSKMFVVEK
ncbi:MAG: cytochrome C oxidase subunit II [Rhodospirillales bacterium RIFCSPLOWO2_12_FULL_58_28]|nr:MAG: cytochrome C oxidase subunit II [Rhodospirillales bacterium RIFCSPLOWO2_02_FULL_58_16]OHC79312.1 MAG: cytochrome C oxidase subunit II [Rhodospirillales bacterium RIFCSPLOWO2_12_FULL_58_28]